MTDFHPRVVAFVCKWCTYAGADLAGMSRTEYSPEVRTLMLPCSGRIEVEFVIRAFLQGADGVLVSGCHPGDCHYTAGNYRARRRWTLFRDLLDVLGFDLRRLEFAWISAAEGGKWASTIEGFTQRLKEIGPYEAMRRVTGDRTPGPTAPPAAPRNGPPKAPDAPADLHSRLQEALQSGAVDGVLAWKRSRTLGRAVPAWLVEAGEVRDLAAPESRSNMVRLLCEPEVRKMARVGVVARPSEVASLKVLAQEARVEPARFVVFPPDGSDPMPLEEAPSAHGFDDPTTGLLDDLMARTPEERWDFWTAQAARCVKCYACRGSCPMCGCTQCLADKNRPQWFPTASDGAGNLAWMIIRAFHLAGRCVGCGACQEACPAGIPLNVLSAALARSAERNFGWRAGEDLAATPLQADYRPDDPEEFIL